MSLYKNDNAEFNIFPDNIPNKGILFDDKSKENRSGHLGHAMVEYAPGKILDFFSNCDGDANGGHNGFGWMELRRSEDSGETWTDKEPFPYSKNLYDMNVGVTALCEKAVCTDDGKIIVFNLICDINENNRIGWEPFGVPTYVISTDNGKTWSKAEFFGDAPGRIYDVQKKDGVIYVLIQLGKDPVKVATEYKLYVSRDNGNTFEERSILPFKRGFCDHTFYGTMGWLPDGKMIVYTYNQLYKGELVNIQEYDLPYAISDDDGKTWSEVKYAHFKKRMRNPQLVKFKNTYFMIGRSGSFGIEEASGHNIIYCSNDGINWDDGQYLAIRTACWAAYSNTLVVHDKDGNDDKLLIQASYAYDLHKTNILHWWVK